MRHKKIFGKDIWLTEEQYYNLLARFHPGRARWTGDRWRIGIQCPLCAATESCKSCTFGKFEGRGSMPGCQLFIRDLVGRERKRKVEFMEDGVYWKAGNDSAARKVLIMLRKRLGQFDFVKRRPRGEI